MPRDREMKDARDDRDDTRENGTNGDDRKGEDYYEAY